MKAHIVTIFDKNHFARALACRKSLYKQAPNATVYFLCLDQVSFDAASKLDLNNTKALRPEDLNDPELLASRKTRTNPEFASTCKPAFLNYMLKSETVKKDELLIFIDPDFYAYEPTEDLFRKIYGLGSIVITPHRFPAHREGDKYAKGVYNAGIVFFRNDANALKCIEEWRKQCIDWCYLRYEDGKIGDQGYMSDWAKKYSSVHELADKGVNLSTWNIENYKIVEAGPEKFLIDGEPLIFYHFHGLKLYFDRKNKVRAYPISIYHKKIYKPYLTALDDAYKKLQAIDPNWNFGTLPSPSLARFVKQLIWKQFVQK